MTRYKKKKSKKHFLKKIIILGNILLAFALLLAYLASMVDPRSITILAFFGLAYPLLLFCNLLLVIYWLIKKPQWALISLIPIFMGWKFLVSYIGFHEETPINHAKTTANTLRVITYNVHSFKPFGDKNTQKIKTLFLSILKDEQPDILCFQEFFTRTNKEYNFKKAVAGALQMPYFYYQPKLGNDYETIGLAIFSKYPILKSGLISFEEKTSNGSIFVDIKAHNRIFRVYNVHLQSIRFKPEDYKYLNDFKQNMETDVASSLRISSRLKRAFIKRSIQVASIKAHTQTCQTPYIIAGDFNDTPISYAVNHLLSGGLINTFKEKGSGFGITYNGDFPNFQIDYILATPDFKVQNYHIIKRKISDHYAVRSDLTIH